MQNQPRHMPDDASADILELLEIAQALARAETALLTSNRVKAALELQDLQQRAAALAMRLQAEAPAADAHAA